MANGELLLTQDQQLNLAANLYRADLFGIKKDPDEYGTTKSGRRTPHYLDLRPGISDYHTRKLVAEYMLDLTEKRIFKRAADYPHDVYTHFAGTPEAMTSYATTIADLAQFRLLQPRVDINKTSGNKTPILGKFENGDTVAEYDDVVTDGDSKISTIRSLGAAGLKVVDYYVVLDREEGGAAQVKAETGIDITPALGLSSMVQMLRAEGYIKSTEYDNVAEYIAQYGDPHAKATLGVE